MLSPDEELQSRKNSDDEPRPCRNCVHSRDEHFYDEYAETIAFCEWCGCTQYEPKDAGDILELEHPEES